MLEDTAQDRSTKGRYARGPAALSARHQRHDRMEIFAFFSLVRGDVKKSFGSRLSPQESEVKILLPEPGK